MSIIQSISDHRAAVVALPAASLYNALTINSVYKLYKTVSAGVIECYIKITSKTPITLPGEQTPYDCSITGPAVYIEKNSSNVITGAEIGIRSISNLISNKTHLASDNWLIYTSSISEYNSMVDLVIDNMSSGTIAGPSGEIESISDHRAAVENLPAPALYNALTVNSIYMLQKQSSNKTIKCYIKIASKTAITYPNTSDIYDCTITGPAVYIETDSSGNITLGEIGKREITNLISSKTHLASDNWAIYTSNASEYNAMVDEVISYIIYTTPDPNHLSFTSKQNGSTVYIKSITDGSISTTPPDFEYSYDLVTWTSWTYTTTSPSNNRYTHTFSTLTLNFNERIYVRSHSDTLNIGASTNTYTQFYMTGRFNASGNIQSLINYSTSVPAYCYYNLFKSCTSLISAPTLPATILGTYCYQYMFYGCTSLTTPPTLPATSVVEGCYQYMFYGCTSLTTAPALPATAVARLCYSNMFRGCSSLTTPPALPATSVLNNGNYCYSYMFCGCTSLTTAPELSLITLGGYDYQGMFYGCTSLTTAPALPAVTLKTGCYQYMFQNCSNLTKCADMQKATTVASSSCQYMYANCSKLDNAITPYISSWNTSYFSNWLSGVASTGILYKPSSLTDIPTNNVSGCPTGWSTSNSTGKVRLSAQNTPGFSYTYNGTTGTVASGEVIELQITDPKTITINAPSALYLIKVGNNYVGTSSAVINYIDAVGRTITCPDLISQNPLCFTAQQAGSTISMTHTGTNQTSTKPTIYILRNGSVSTWNFSSITLSNVGDNVYMFGFNSTMGGSGENVSVGANSSSFVMTGRIAASGNTQSLVSFSSTASKGCFANLFKNCAGITTAPALPATTLAYGCYEYMFYGCTSLTTAPELPATTLSDYCYYTMFQGCTALVTPPELPATTLGTYCYQYMFRGCTSLTTAPELPATVLKNYCYSHMFYECTSLTTAPELPATTLANYCYQNMFRGCTNLTTAPELPATTLATSCYAYMFQGCTSLTAAPALDATTLANNCYQAMFYGCTSITVAPDLPATSINMSCYSNMFYGCTSLIAAPELPATTLASSCYQYMFHYCTSLTTAPELPATTLANNCYAYMFNSCTSLTTAPEELPAMTLKTSCYAYMFQGCTNLTTAPELPATTLVSNCYQYMFRNCRSLNYIKVGATSWNTTYASNWVNGVAASGVFEKPFNVSIPTGVSGIPSGWFGALLTFTATTNNSSIQMRHYGTNQSTTKPVIYMSRDGGSTWTQWNFAAISLNTGGKVLMYGNNPNGISFSTANYSTFYFYGSVSASGNITALITPDGTASVTSYCYYKLFNGCTSLMGAPELPATSLSDYCYRDMFYGCNSLTTAPELPATTLANSCYQQMFASCASLTAAPELPATTLFTSCYYNMFYNCTGLIEVPETLPATTLAQGCYQSMFASCTSLTTTPELPATALAPSCYYQMFYGCTSLTTAPELPATTLDQSCYVNMFYNCTSLTTAPETLPATALAQNCYSGMFYNCTSLTTAPETLPATTLTANCYYSMFRGCTSLTTAPELPATALAQNCYRYMFQDCSSLNYIKVGATSWNTSYTTNWVSGVAASGTFKKSSSTSIATGVSGIPSGWTVVNV